MGKTIGIDLGTTNSVMCIMITEPEIIQNREHNPLTPSVVACRKSKRTGDSFLIGKLAMDYSKAAEKDYIYSIKRLMGRSYDDKEVQKIKIKVSYDIVESPEGKEDVVRVALGEKLYNPKEISAMILKKLKEDGELKLGDKIDSAVITVPAYFNERQRHATREAGLMAGLKVKKIIDEPTAAALAFGVIKSDDEGRMLLVFDLGGGTFDVSILMMLGGIFKQMNTEGDMWLGGDDFDSLIMDQVIKYIEKEHRLTNLTSNKPFIHDLRKKAREAKEMLSTQHSAEIIITDTLKDETGLPLAIEYEITRNEFEKLIQPSVELAMDIVKKAVKGGGLDKDDIDSVLLVGGSSSIPKFQEAIEKYFGKEKVLRSLDPMTCVAQGAAIQAKSMGNNVCCPMPKCEHLNPLDVDKCEKCGADLAAAKEQVIREENIKIKELGEITSHPYGIEIEGDVFEEIIPKGSEFPTREPYNKQFRTIAPNQRLIKSPVRSGFSKKASENEFMGNIWFRNLPPGLPQGTRVEVSMGLDNNQIFTLTCQIPGTDWKQKATLQHEGWENAVLDEAMNANLVIQKMGLPPAKAEQFKEHIQAIEEAVNESNQEKATQHIKKLKELEIEPPPPPPGWQTILNNIITLTESIINRIKSIFTTDDANYREFLKWKEEAKQVIKSDDTAKGDDMVKEGIEKVLNVKILGELVMATLAMNSPNVDPALAARIEQAKMEVYDAIDRQDIPGLEKAWKNFLNLLNEITKQFGQGGKGSDAIGVLLGATN